MTLNMKKPHWLKELFSIDDIDKIDLEKIEELRQKWSDMIGPLNEIDNALKAIIDAKKHGKTMRKSVRQALIRKLINFRELMEEGLSIEHKVETEQKTILKEEEKSYGKGENFGMSNYDYSWVKDGANIDLTCNNLQKYFGGKKIKFGGNTNEADIRFSRFVGEIYFSIDMADSGRQMEGGRGEAAFSLNLTPSVSKCWSQHGYVTKKTQALQNVQIAKDELPLHLTIYTKLKKEGFYLIRPYKWNKIKISIFYH